jgi:hypothetical protein
MPNDTQERIDRRLFIFKAAAVLTAPVVGVFAETRPAFAQCTDNDPNPRQGGDPEGRGRRCAPPRTQQPPRTQPQRTGRRQHCEVQLNNCHSGCNNLQGGQREQLRCVNNCNASYQCSGLPD